MKRVALFRVLSGGLLAGVVLLVPACGTTTAARESFFSLRTERGKAISGVGSTAPAWDGRGSYFLMAIEPEAGKPIPGKAGQARQEKGATFYSTRPGAEGAAAPAPVELAGSAEEIVPVAPELPIPAWTSESRSQEAPPAAAQETPAPAATPPPAAPAVAPAQAPPPPPAAVAAGGDSGHDEGGDSGDKDKKKKKKNRRKKDKDQ